MAMSARPRILALLGGAALFGQELGNIEALAALENRGCDVLCLVRSEAWSTQITSALDARGLRWRKVPYLLNWMPGRIGFMLRNPFVFLAANWQFYRIARQYRPTHIHTCNSFYILNFLIGLVLVRAPLIYRAGDEPQVHRAFWRALWRFVLWRAERYVANSKFVERALIANGVKPDRITLIYNYPPSQGRTFSSEISIPHGTRAIAYVGQIAPHKGVHLLIEAFRELATLHPQVHLVIAGRISEWSGDAWARSLRDRTAQDELISRRVTFLGYVENVAVLLDRCEFLVAPSIFQDPSPNIVTQAKLTGRPSIVFPNGGLPELVENGVDGLVCREASVAALTEALRVYLDDPTLVSIHGRAAVASLSRLGVNEFGERWLGVYSAAENGRCSPQVSSAALSGS